MKIGSLFSGGGLGDFGFMAAGMEIAWQCEIDEYCQEILELRYPESKKYRDIKDLKGVELEQVDIITGGFPNPEDKIRIWKRYWSIEPNVGRVANGITKRVDRLKLLGNGQVTACTYVIGKMIMDIENDTQNLRRQ